MESLVTLTKNKTKKNARERNKDAVICLMLHSGFLIPGSPSKEQGLVGGSEHCNLRGGQSYVPDRKLR